jgi:hypothetical protein
MTVSYTSFSKNKTKKRENKNSLLQLLR